MKLVYEKQCSLQQCSCEKKDYKVMSHTNYAAVHIIFVLSLKNFLSPNQNLSSDTLYPTMALSYVIAL
jgi:hypothetical protein